MATFRLAQAVDVPALLPLMRDFYEYERLPFDAARSERLLRELIGDERLGRVLLFQFPLGNGARQTESHDSREGTLVGYMILTFGYSLEFGGRDALIDEFYVVPSARGGGCGTQAIAHAVEICRSLGITNIHLEADYFNERVHEFYKRLGFRDHERHLMTLET
jgi:GNAT superfamily N-acetyltransferase